MNSEVLDKARFAARTLPRYAGHGGIGRMRWKKPNSYLHESLFIGSLLLCACGSKGEGDKNGEASGAGGVAGAPGAGLASGGTAGAGQSSGGSDASLTGGTGGAAAGTGGSAGGEFQSTGVCKYILSQNSGDHHHGLDPFAQLLTGKPVVVYSVPPSDVDGHRHFVTVTSDHTRALKMGGQVRLKSCGEHDHEYILNCNEPGAAPAPPLDCTSDCGTMPSNPCE